VGRLKLGAFTGDWRQFVEEFFLQVESGRDVCPICEGIGKCIGDCSMPYLIGRYGELATKSWVERRKELE